jgi:hypothetical protein
LLNRGRVANLSGNRVGEEADERRLPTGAQLAKLPHEVESPQRG